MGSLTREGPSLDQMQAWHEARAELPKLGAGAAVALCRTHARSVWVREAFEAEVITAMLIGRFTLPTDLGIRWPVLAVRITRKSSPLGRRRTAMLMLTRTKPGKWSVWEAAKLPRTATPGV